MPEKMFTPEQLKNQAERVKADAKLINGGAKYVQNENESEPRLQLADHQFDEVENVHKKDVEEKEKSEFEKTEEEILEDVIKILQQKELPNPPEEWHTQGYSSLSSDEPAQKWLLMTFPLFKTLDIGGDQKINKQIEVLYDVFKGGDNGKLYIRDIKKINEQQKEKITSAILDAVYKECEQYKNMKDYVE
jgi:hypothetical protein